jgi:excisionase family DNA binding protein
MTPQSQPCLTVSDICERFNISRATVYRQVNAGALRLFKIGRATRFRASDVQQWADTLAVEAER